MENEGIMSLPAQGMPETDESLYLAAKQAAVEKAPEQTSQFSSAIQQGLGEEGMTQDDARQLLQLIDYIIANAANYPQIRQQLIAQGLADPEDLPEQFNAQFFAALKAGLLEFVTSGAGPTMPMAQGGLASLGRFGDTQLAHINPEEAAVLRAMGGRGSINPRTGLPEYFSFKGLLKKAVRVVGTIALTAVGVPPPIAAAITTKVTGGSWKEAFISGVTAGVGEVVSPFIGEMIGGSLPTVLQPYVNDVAQGIFSTGVGLARGQSFGKALQGGVEAGLSSAGIGAIRNTMNQYEQAGQQEAQANPANVSAPSQSISPSDVNAATPGPNVPASTAGPANPSPQPAAVPPPVGPAAVPPPAVAPPALMTYDSAGNLVPVGSTLAVQGPAPIQQAAITQTGTSATAGQPSGIASLIDKTTDFTKGIMPGAREEAGLVKANAQAEKAFQDSMARTAGGTLSEANRITLAEQAANAARKAAMPGPIGTYGPAVAAGIGLLGATGGFETKPIEVPEEFKTTGVDLLRQYPHLYSLAQPVSLYGYRPPTRVAGGGIMNVMAAGGYPRRTGQIAGPGTEKSDDIPAMLSDGEFVLTARAVRGAGSGSRREGAKRLYRLMHMLEKRAPARA